MFRQISPLSNPEDIRVNKIEDFLFFPFIPSGDFSSNPRWGQFPQYNIGGPHPL